jgi:hypothetical protein
MSELMPGTNVVAEALLFSELLSGVALLTVAMLVKNVFGGVIRPTWTTSVNVAPLVTARLGFVQFTVPPDPTSGVVQFHPLGDASETNVSPEGRVSFNAALAALSGPLLATTMVYVMSVSGEAVSGPVLVTETSIEFIWTTVSAVELLFPSLLSAVVVLTFAVLLIFVPDGVAEST